MQSTYNLLYNYTYNYPTWSYYFVRLLFVFMSKILLYTSTNHNGMLELWKYVYMITVPRTFFYFNRLNYNTTDTYCSCPKRLDQCCMSTYSWQRRIRLSTNHHLPLNLSWESSSVNHIKNNLLQSNIFMFYIFRYIGWQTSLISVSRIKSEMKQMND